MSGHSNRGGTTVLILENSKHIRAEAAISHYATDDKVTSVEVELQGHPARLVSVYARVETTQRKAFFTRLASSGVITETS